MDSKTKHNIGIAPKHTHTHLKLVEKNKYEDNYNNNNNINIINNNNNNNNTHTHTYEKRIRREKIKQKKNINNRRQIKQFGNLLECNEDNTPTTAPTAHRRTLTERERETMLERNMNELIPNREPNEMNS